MFTLIKFSEMFINMLIKKIWVKVWTLRVFKLFKSWKSQKKSLANQKKTNKLVQVIYFFVYFYFFKMDFYCIKSLKGIFYVLVPLDSVWKKTAAAGNNKCCDVWSQIESILPDYCVWTHPLFRFHSISTSPVQTVDKHFIYDPFIWVLQLK